ncbi:MAG: MBL fold metallo-hydrolase [Candidatus Enteromonas sp.]|nr:MBL fold metallo-hydrolase [Candidatus Enteromonas sp.]MEE3443188.1 MBL fold metallo-hydrolase [Candidatus Enteromonas sp.]
MEIRTFSYSDSFANSYLLIDGDEGVLFDPGYNENHVLETAVKAIGIKLLGIFVTHGHFDHFFGLKEWDKETMPPVFFPKDDVDALGDPNKNVSYFYYSDVETVELTPYQVEDGDEIKLGRFLIKVIATPYHTIGSVCYLIEEANALISGDSLFCGGLGRSDLPSGDARMMASSLDKLSKLPPNTIVYPGHGPKTTIKNEFSRR